MIFQTIGVGYTLQSLSLALFMSLGLSACRDNDPSCRDAECSETVTSVNTFFPVTSSSATDTGTSSFTGTGTSGTTSTGWGDSSTFTSS